MKHLHNIFLLTTLLAAAPAFAALPEKDTLRNMPWQQTVSTDLMTSGAQAFSEEDMSHMPTADIRKRLRGLFLSAQVLENCGGLNQSGVMTSPFFNSDQISVQSRCFWNIACIIDDVPVPMNQYLMDPNQIESITLITDIADKASYGPVANGGAFLIKTKKGGYNTPLRMTFDVESGIETPDIWPEYCNGVQYAMLNNIARRESGYTPLYTEEDIKGFALNDPNNIKYPNADYRSLFFRSTKPVSRFGFNATAGSNNVKFNASLNGLYGGDLIKIGPESYFSKLNLSAGVTAKIGEWIEANFTFNGLATFNQDGTGAGYWEANTTSPVEYPLIIKVDPESEYYDPSIMETGTTIYGVSRIFDENAFAQQMEGGYSRCKRRSGMFSSTVDFDMSWLLPGLKSKTFVSTSTFFSATMGKSEDYLAYYWDRNLGLDGRSINHLGKKESAEAVQANSTFQTMNAYERLSYDWARHGHKVSANATGWITKASASGKETSTKLLSGIGTVKYSYNDKYVLDLVADWSGTTLFPKKNRFGFFPSVGAAWNVDKENFLKNSSWLNRLKLRAQYGQVGSIDIYGTADNMWQSSYSLSKNNFYHFGPRTGTSWIGNLIEYLTKSGLSRIENDNLDWPVITEIDAGFDATLFNHLDVNFNWYKAVQSDVIKNVSEEYSSTLGQIMGGGATYAVTSAITDNFDQYTYTGWELGLDWHQGWKDFSYNIGVQGRHWDKINDKVTGNFYTYEYQNQIGRHASEWKGYIYEGLLTEEDIASGYPTLSPEAVAGDLKYKDVNEDGKIDANDKMYISNGNAQIRYSINLGLRYKKFDLNVIGSGQAFYKTCLTSNYFMGGNSIYNYSKFIWNNLYKDANGNPGAFGENFPHLTYTYNSNNFECSDYWLRNGGWFKIHSAELGYTTDLKKVGWIKQMRISLRASNLLTLTGLEYIDPEANIAGIEASPLYKAYSAGVKFTF